MPSSRIEGQDRGQERELRGAGDQIALVALQPHPAATGQRAAPRHLADPRRAAVGQPVDRAAAGLDQRRQALRAGPHVRQLLSIDRAHRDVGRELPVLDPIEPRLLGRQRGARDPLLRRLQGDLRGAPRGRGHGHGLGLRVQRAALDRDRVTRRLGAQRLLLELRLLHQPVHQAAQQQALRAAALEAARPQPGVVGEQLRDAALADPLEHQQRLLGGAAHQHLGARRPRRRPAGTSGPTGARRRSAARLSSVVIRSAVTGWRWPSSVSAGLKPRS